MAPIVPVVDLSPWRFGDAADRARVAAEVDDACRRIGFLQVVGHGVEASVIDEMRTATASFFAMPTADKLATRPAHLEVNRGYAAKGSESLAYSVGVERPTDLFEAFNIGPDSPDLTDPKIAAVLDSYFAANVWPHSLPQLRPALVTYFAAMAGVSRLLLDVFAVALGLPEHYFDTFTTHSTQTMRAINYERQPGEPAPLDGQMRMGGHTDYGILTVLYADPVPGLQIVDPDGAWYDVMPTPGGFIVNLGDLIAQWTNDHWRSTIHRVVPPPHGDDSTARRRSVAFYEDGDYDAMIECLPTCCSDERPAKYEPITAGEHLMTKEWAAKKFVPAEVADSLGERIGAVTND